MISDGPVYDDVSAKYLNGLEEWLKTASAEDREKGWWIFEGNPLVETLKLVATQKISYLEVVGNRSGELRREDSGYCALSANLMDLLLKSAHVSPLDFDLAKRICTQNLAHVRLQLELQVLAAFMLSGSSRAQRRKMVFTQTTGTETCWS